MRSGRKLETAPIASAPVPADSTAMHLVDNEPHCPTASWNLVHEAVHIAKHSDQKLHVGPIVSSDLFYNPNEGQYERWSARGVLAVEMEAAALYAFARAAGVAVLCLAHVTNTMGQSGEDFEKGHADGTADALAVLAAIAARYPV